MAEDKVSGRDLRPEGVLSSDKSVVVGESSAPDNNSVSARAIKPPTTKRASSSDKSVVVGESSAPDNNAVSARAIKPSTTKRASSSDKSVVVGESSAPDNNSVSARAIKPPTTKRASSSDKSVVVGESSAPDNNSVSARAIKPPTTKRTAKPKQASRANKIATRNKVKSSTKATATTPTKSFPNIMPHDDEVIEDALGKGMFAFLEMMVNWSSSLQSSEQTKSDPLEVIRDLFSEEEIKKWQGVYFPPNWIDKIQENTKDITYLSPFSGMNFIDVFSPENIKMMSRLYDLSLYQQNLVHGIKYAKEDFPDYQFDKRFSSQHWEESLTHNMLRHLYLIFSEWWTEVVTKSIEGNEDIGLRDRKRLEFSLKQLINALSPSNYLMSNPEAVEETLNTRGYNLVKGMEHFFRDILDNKGHWKISTVDKNAFEVGGNLAITNGEVIHSTELYELIQYAPSCDKECLEPLLIVPPAINKYYILDMQEHNSFVRWAVSQGLSVFIMSWVNPDSGLKQAGFDDYVMQIDDALKEVLIESGSEKAHVLGYCVGGTMLATNLARKAKQSGSNENIASATFLTTLIDFNEVGEIDVFLNEQQMSLIEKSLSEKGYFDAYDMANSFSLLRSNDMIWSFVVNNYLLGKEPSHFDLLYWNSDSTNLTEAFFRKYMDIAYIGNKLCKKGAVKVDGVPIDMSLISIPSCFVATEEDHISPWESCFDSTLLLSGEKTFILGGSGHVNGVINPPAKNKYFYRGKKIGNYSSPDKWKESCEAVSGSWWDFWKNWIRENSKGEINARPVAQKHTSLGKAPGKYVLLKS